MPNKSRDCPICESSQTSFFVEKNGYPLSKCSACDLVYIDPELPPVSLEPLYNEQGAPEIGERYPYDKIEHRRKRAKIRAFRVAKYFKGKDAIDVGCGGGYMVDAMQNAGANATGIDLDPEADDMELSLRTRPTTTHGKSTISSHLNKEAWLLWSSPRTSLRRKKRLGQHNLTLPPA